MDSQYCTGLSNIVIHYAANSVEQGRCAEKIAILAKIAGYHATVVKECSPQQRPKSQWEEGLEKHVCLNSFLLEHLKIFGGSMAPSISNARMKLKKRVFNQLIKDCVHKMLKATPFMPSTVTGIGRAFLFLERVNELLESCNWREILPKLNEELKGIASDWHEKTRKAQPQPTIVQQIFMSMFCCSPSPQTATVTTLPTQEAQAVDPKMFAENGPSSIIKGMEKPCFADILLAIDLAQHNEQLDWIQMEYAKQWLRKMLKEVNVGFASCGCGSVECLKTLVKQRSTKLSAFLPDASSNDIVQEEQAAVATNDIEMTEMSMEPSSSMQSPFDTVV